MYALQTTDRQTDTTLYHKRDRYYGGLKIGVPSLCYANAVILNVDNNCESVWNVSFYCISGETRWVQRYKYSYIVSHILRTCKHTDRQTDICKNITIFRGGDNKCKTKYRTLHGCSSVVDVFLVNVFLSCDHSQMNVRLTLQMLVRIAKCAIYSLSKEWYDTGADPEVSRVSGHPLFWLGCSFWRICFCISYIKMVSFYSHTSPGMHKNSPLWYKKYKNVLRRGTGPLPDPTPSAPLALDLRCPFQIHWTPAFEKS